MNWEEYEGFEFENNAKILEEKYPDLAPITSLKRVVPPFYKHGLLIDANNGQGVFVFAQYKMMRLTGKSEDIRWANSLSGLQITRDNAIDYIIFFTDNLKFGDEDGIHIVREGDRLVGENGKSMKPILPEIMSSDSLTEHFMAASAVRHGYLNSVEMSCNQYGHVEMPADMPIAPVRLNP